VEQRGGDPLVPGAPLIEQVLIQPGQRPGLQHVLRRDPALGQIPRQQVHPQMPGIGLIRFRVPFPPAQRRGIRRLGQMRRDPGRGQLPSHIPPAGAPLQGEVDILQAGEAGQPGPQMLPVSRDHPAPLQLPGHRVQILERQLAAVHVERTYDAPKGPPRAPTEDWDKGPVP